MLDTIGISGSLITIAVMIGLVLLFRRMFKKKT
ncbi:DUF3149 domain-containing protein [Planococcus shenhongbingii]